MITEGTPQASAPQFVPIPMAVKELSADVVACVTVRSCRIALLRWGNEVLAFKDECPHGDTSFEGERLRAGRLRCPLHGACFDPETGIPISGPAQSPLQRIESRINAHGHIEIALPNPHSGEDP